jgi:hypothetical protein
VAGDYLVALVYQDRIGKAKFLDGGGYLFGLFTGVRPCVAWIRFPTYANGSSRTG